MKTPFLQKAKQMLLSSVALGAVYAGTLAYRGYAQEAEKASRDSLEQNLPSPLTQQGEDFYKNPEKELFFYRKAYTESAEDRVIDSKDIEQLELVLRETLKEMQNKIYDERKFDKSFSRKFESISSFESAAYRDLYERRLEDLKELQKHLELKKEWLASDACQGKFWNYGSGIFIYNGIMDNGNVREPHDYSRGSLHEGYKGLEVVFRDRFYKANLPSLKNVGDPNVLELWEEFPAKNRINYWLGLALGLSAPLASITFLINLRMKKTKKNECSEGEGMFDLFNGLINPAFGFALLDSLHPLVYPARLIIPPLAYSFIVMKSKPSPASSASSPATSPSSTSHPSSPSILEEKIENPWGEKLKLPFTNPWDIDIPKIEDKKISAE